MLLSPYVNYKLHQKQTNLTVLHIYIYQYDRILLSWMGQDNIYFTQIYAYVLLSFGY